KELGDADEMGDRGAGVLRRIDLQVHARVVVAPRDAVSIEDHHAVGKRARGLTPTLDDPRELRFPARARAPGADDQRVERVPCAAGTRRLRRLAALEPEPERSPLPQVVEELREEEDREEHPTPLR